MIVDDELPVAAATDIAVESVAPPEVKRRRSIFGGIAVFLFFLAVVIALQIASGAYQAEFSAYPDEPAHYVTSLMLRNYIVHFHFESPIRFAQDYYNHYPKVAFGHWPPFFYFVQSAWMLLFSASRASIRLQMAFTTALLGYSMFVEGRRWFNWKAGVLAGLLVVCLPLVQDYSDQEMAEALLTLLCFWTAIYFARYVETEKLSNAVLFGVLFSLAVLTKGSGWLLALIPPVVLILTNRLRLMKKVSFWVPVALVTVVCVPWQLMTMRLAERGWEGGPKPSISYTVDALIQFLGLFPKILGPVLVGLLLCGLLSKVVKPALRLRVPSSAASAFALLLAVWIFHSLVPAGVEDRKLVLAVPAMVLFIFAGGQWLADLLPSGGPLYRWRYELVAAVSALAFLVSTFSIPHIQHYGFIEAARFIESHPEFRDSKILVSSESGGEGLLISELAMKSPQPETTIIRATKALADVEWDGRNYQPKFSDAEQLRRFLRDDHIQYVVLDNFAPQIRFPHNALLRQALKTNKACPLIASFHAKQSGIAGEVQVYRLQQ